ncbi:MAG: hypothetical protein B1H07_00025 [Campylobacteraceae bacterium 4484_166]|nr:MAG: hypothetical protein B1H07_00025 [Campylobacteraceae bacterium 4484_166]
MKKIFLICLIITINLYARENPFEHSKSFDDIKMQKDEIVSTDKQKNKKTKEQKKEQKDKIDKKDKISNSDIVLKPANFLTIVIKKHSLQIKQKNYRLLRSRVFRSSNKIILDFVSRKKFKSNEYRPAHKIVKRVSVGAHYDEGFYRVIVQLKTRKTYKTKKLKHSLQIRF